jgi:hypothetical protein
MRNTKRTIVGILTGALIGLAACSSASSDWDKASAANTIAAYQEFIKNHPSDSHVGEAKSLIAQQEDNDAWAAAQQSKSIEGYRAYLDKYPQGTNAPSAQTALSDLTRANDWKTAQTGGAPEIRAFLQKYSSGPEADEAKAKLKALTAFHARFATEPSESRARKKLMELQRRLGQQVSDLQVVPASDQKSYYVDSGGMTEEAANALCQSLKKTASHCTAAQE